MKRVSAMEGYKLVKVMPKCDARTLSTIDNANDCMKLKRGPQCHSSRRDMPEVAGCSQMLSVQLSHVKSTLCCVDKKPASQDSHNCK